MAIHAIPRSTRSTGSNRSRSPRRGTTCSGSWRTCRSTGHGLEAARGFRSRPICIAAPPSNSGLRRGPRSHSTPRVLTAGDLRSEIALGTNLQQNRILILELVERVRHRSRRRENRTARHLLIEVEPLHFTRNSKTFDGRPTANHTELRNVEIGIATIGSGTVPNQRLTRMTCDEGCAVRPLGGG